MKKRILSLGVLSLLVAGSTFASDQDIFDALEKIGLPSSNIKITDSPVDGFKMAMTTEGVFYVSNDGKYLTQGPIYSIQGEKPVNIANETMAKLVKSVSKDAIAYKAEDQKYVVTVFTDITCSYCKKLHDDMDEYNKLGITINYLAYPRGGLNSQTAKDMQSIWASADRKTALDRAYKGNTVPAASSMIPYIQNHFNVGRQLGITGTPAIVLANGQVISGYMPPADLKAILEREMD